MNHAAGAVLADLASTWARLPDMDFLFLSYTTTHAMGELSMDATTFASTINSLVETLSTVAVVIAVLPIGWLLLSSLLARR